MEYLYKNWAKIGGIVAPFLLLLLFFNSKVDIGSYWWFFWLNIPLYMIHHDEYVYPGGFKEFVNELQTKDKNSDFPLNDKNTFYINIMFIWILYPVLTVIGSLFSFVILPAIAIMVTVINSTLHVIVAIKMRKPNPGFFASLFINLPIGLYVLIYLVLFQIINGFELIIIIVIGFILHSFLFVFIFRLKKKNMQKQVE